MEFEFRPIIDDYLDVENIFKTRIYGALTWLTYFHLTQLHYRFINLRKAEDRRSNLKIWREMASRG